MRRIDCWRAALTGGLLLAGAASADDTLEQLKAQLAAEKLKIQELEARVDAIERQATSRTSQRTVPGTVALTCSGSDCGYQPQTTVRGDETAELRPNNVPVDPTLKGFVAIPGTDTLVKLGGYARTDVIYDVDPIGTFDSFVTSAIPTNAPDSRRGSQFTVQAKQTRLNIDIRQDTPIGVARMFFDVNFFGNAPDNFTQGSYEPSLRHAVVQVANIGFGYTSTVFMDNGALPDTLDYEGPGAAPSLKTAQVRYTWVVGQHVHITGGIEEPDSQIASPTGGAKQTFPDLTLRARYEAPWGHVHLAGVLRELAVNDGAGDDDHTRGYGVHLAGNVKTFGQDYMVGAVVWGKGIARYISDIGGDNLDAQFQDGKLDALTAKGGYIGYTHYWTAKLSSTEVAGWLEMDNESFQPATAFRKSEYYSANVIWNPYGSLNVGMEMLYGINQVFDGAKGDDTRMQFTAQYGLNK